MKQQRLLGITLAFLGAILYSTKAVFVKLAYQYDVDAVTLLLLRMLFSLPFYLGIAIYISRKSSNYKLTRKDYQLLFFLGIIGYYLSSFLDFKGLEYITASLERLILFIYPTIVVLIGYFIFKEKINRSQVIALILAYIGIAIVFIGNVDIENQQNLIIGSLLIVACAVLFAVYMVGSGQILPRLGTWRFTSYALTISSVAVILHYIIENQGIGSFDYPFPVFGYSLLMATISTVIPTLLISEAIRLIGASNVAIIGSVGPISTITLAWIFLDERLAFIQILGGILVLSGVVFISVSRKKK
ncbi:MAG: DMT family transporter [Saprospiraceae bacterium]